MRNAFQSLAFTVLLAATPAVASDAKPFITAKDLDLTTILQPPPANDSAQTKAELGEILTIQVTRTPAMEQRANADAEEEIWRYADVMGPKFTKEALPKTAALFDRINETEESVTELPKKTFARPRPHILYPDVKPVVPLSKSGAYPSGHTTRGTLWGVILSNMVPEKRREIMVRAWEYGNNRIIGGIHYRSDVDAGRIGGSIIAEELLRNAEFKTEFEAAKTELRAVLGL